MNAPDVAHDRPTGHEAEQVLSERLPAAVPKGVHEDLVVLDGDGVDSGAQIERALWKNKTGNIQTKTGNIQTKTGNVQAKTKNLVTSVTIGTFQPSRLNGEQEYPLFHVISELRGHFSMSQ